MLRIRLIMNSAVEEIFGFKTCCGVKSLDQNLEIHVKNEGISPVVVSSYFDIETPQGRRRVDTVTPPGEHLIEPGGLLGLYCFMEETIWEAADRLIFYDKEGKAYPVFRQATREG